MKKVIGLLITFLCLLPINVYGISKAELGDTNITARVNSIINNEVFNVDLVWDQMTFIYNKEKKYIWDSSTHEYKFVENSFWKLNDNTITIKNKSLFSIDVSFYYNKSIGFNNLNGYFNNNEIHLNKDEKKTTTLLLNGKLDSSISSYTKIGSVTVVIS